MKATQIIMITFENLTLIFKLNFIEIIWYIKINEIETIIIHLKGVFYESAKSLKENK